MFKCVNPFNFISKLRNPTQDIGSDVLQTNVKRPLTICGKGSFCDVLPDVNDRASKGV